MQVIGVITRKDIAEANAKLALGRKANLGLTAHSDQLVRPGTLPFIPYEAYDPTVGRSADQLTNLSVDVNEGASLRSLTTALTSFFPVRGHVWAFASKLSKLSAS